MPAPAVSGRFGESQDHDLRTCSSQSPGGRLPGTDRSLGRSPRWPVVPRGRSGPAGWIPSLRESGEGSDPHRLGEEIGGILLQRGGDAILQEVYGAQSVAAPQQP